MIKQSKEVINEESAITFSSGSNSRAFFCLPNSLNVQPISIKVLIPESTNNNHKEIPAANNKTEISNTAVWYLFAFSAPRITAMVFLFLSVSSFDLSLLRFKTATAKAPIEEAVKTT